MIRASIAVIFTLIGLFSIAPAEDPLALKNVPLNTFFLDDLEGYYPFSIPVPKDYEPADPQYEYLDYAYWMEATYAEEYLQTEDGSKVNGYMYGKVSMSVGYDNVRDVFVGVEDPESVAEFKRLFSEVTFKRAKVGSHAILLTTAYSEEDDVRVYAMYIATNIATNALYIAFLPPNNDKKTGDFVWKKLKECLDTADKNVSKPPKNSPTHRGSASAIESMGTEGNPISADALQQLVRSADQGDPRSQYNLGLAYASGRGVAQDYSRALHWYRKAADQAYPTAFHALGTSYYLGHGVEADVDKAFAWLVKGVEAGHTMSYYYLGILCGEGYKPGLPEDSPWKANTTALSWYKAGAELGESNAQYRLGTYYYGLGENGSGTSKDEAEAYLKQAREQYQKASGQGHIGATIDLGVMYLIGTGGPVDYKKARELLEIAAGKGAARAIYELGTMYNNGEGVVKDVPAAITWFEKAAMKGLPLAQWELARIHLVQGSDTEDPAEAYAWVLVLAKSGISLPPEDMEEISRRLTPPQTEKAHKRAAALEKTIRVQGMEFEYQGILATEE